MSVSDGGRDYEERPYFMGPCACDHDEDMHCPCEAGWEE